MTKENPPGAADAQAPGSQSVFDLPRELTTDALRYWEIRRVFYNALLAVLANVAYSSVHVADVFIELMGFRASRARWRRALLVAGFAIASGLALLSAGASFVGASSAADRSPLLTSFLATDFEKVAHVEAIPDTLAAALKAVLSGKSLVNPAYLDKATNTWKPSTADRLLFAGKSPLLWFVYFERQGPPSSTHLIVFEVTKGTAILDQEHVITTDLAFSLPALKSMIRAKQYAAAGALSPGPGAGR